jgi:hypothetical protein
VREQGRGDERQHQHLGDREHYDQRGYQHRHQRPRADGAAGGDRRRYAADRDAGGKRRRPLARKAEPLAGDVVNDGPVDQVRLGDGGKAAQHQRTGERKLAGRRDREIAAENDDGDLDVKLRPHRLFDGGGEARQKIGDDQAGDQRENIRAFVGKPQRPADAEFLLLRRRDRGEMGVVADDPARIGDPEHRRESQRKTLDVGFQRRG